MTNQEIKTVGQTIAAETQIGGNTAERVGGVIEGIGEALDNKDAAVGYYLATMSGSTIYINASSYRLRTGGNLRAKMPAAATTACTLTVGNANAVPLWYNGAAVSADNSWEAGEIVTIYYDGTRFMASNSQGGGGQFGSGEKIKDILLSQVLGAGTAAITSQKGVSDAIFNEIDISSIDTLKTLNDALAPSSSLKPTYYTVTATLSNVKLKVGSMAVISDNMRHVVTEIMATHYLLDDAGNLTNEHSDAEIFFIYRSVKLSGGTLPDPAGTWTKWRYVNSSVWSTVAEKIKYDNSQSGLAAKNVQEALDEASENILKNNVIYEESDWLLAPVTHGYLYGDWSYNENYSRTHTVIEVSPTETPFIKVTANINYDAQIGFLKTYVTPTSHKQPADWCDGFSYVTLINAGKTSILPIPQDCNFIVININEAASGYSYNRKPSSVALGHSIINDVEKLNADNEDYDILSNENGDIGWMNCNITDAGALTTHENKTCFFTADLMKYGKMIIGYDKGSTSYGIQVAYYDGTKYVKLNAFSSGEFSYDLLTDYPYEKWAVVMWSKPALSVAFAADFYVKLIKKQSTISAVSDKVESMYEKEDMYFTPSFKPGNVNTSTGAESDSSTAQRSPYYPIQGASTLYFEHGSGWITVYMFDSNFSYIGYHTNPTSIDVSSNNAAYIRIVCAQSRTTTSDIFYTTGKQTESDTLAGVSFSSGQNISDVSIVNDLTTGGANNVLSANQGVQLNKRITYLENHSGGGGSTPNYVLDTESTFKSQVEELENRVIEVRDAFDLGGETVSLGSGCTLLFSTNAAILSNGTLVGNVTAIEGILSKHFDSTLAFSGTWQNLGCPEWFGATGDGTNDDSVGINACIAAVATCNGEQFLKSITLQSKNYYCANAILIPYGSTTKVSINGNGSTIWSTATDKIIMVGSGKTQDSPAHTGIGNGNFYIKDVDLEGNGASTTYGIYVEGGMLDLRVINVRINNVVNGIYAAKDENSSDMLIDGCLIYGYISGNTCSTGAGIKLIAPDNYIANTRIYGFKDGIYTEGTVYLNQVHVLAMKSYTSSFYTSTSFIRMNGGTAHIVNCYNDTQYTFVAGSAISVIVTNSFCYSWTRAAFKIFNVTAQKMIIKNNIFNVTSGSVGITSSSMTSSSEWFISDNQFVNPSNFSSTDDILLTGSGHGATSVRPTPVMIGQSFFDTTLGYPIYWNGSAWVNYMGKSV